MRKKHATYLVHAFLCYMSNFFRWDNFSFPFPGDRAPIGMPSVLIGEQVTKLLFRDVAPVSAPANQQCGNGIGQLALAQLSLNHKQI